MKVLFISPHFPEEMGHFTRGFAEVGATVYGMGDVPESYIPHDVRKHLSGYLHVHSLKDDDNVIEAASNWLRGKSMDRVECNWEPYVELAAKIRERWGIPGMPLRDVIAFRDKDLMKKKVRAAGLRVPHSFRANSVKDIHQAAEQIGYPIIVKPIAGAGSADTYRINSPEDLERHLPLIRHVPEMNVEEYISGDEFTFDTVCVDGKPRFISVTQYHPRPLEGRLNEWVSPAQITFRDLSRPDLQDGIRLGMGVLSAMNMGTGFTHMEWFRKPNGEVVFGEIGCRSGGGHLVDMMNFSNDFDIYREWARCITWKSWDAPIARRYNVSMCFKRALGQGAIRRYEGLERVRQRCGKWLVWENLNPIGSARRDWKMSLNGDGFLAVRHPDYEECMDMMKFMVRELKIYAG